MTGAGRLRTSPTASSTRRSTTRSPPRSARASAARSASTPAATGGGRRSGCARTDRGLLRAGHGPEGALLPRQLAGRAGPLRQMCYSDLPYLYVGRGFAELNWPYADDPGPGPLRGHGVPRRASPTPPGAAAWLTHWVTGSPDVDARASVARRATCTATRRCVREIRLFVAVNAVGLGVAGLLAAWFLARVHRRPAVGRRALRALAGAAGHRAGQLGPARGGPGRRRALGVVARPTGADRASSSASAPPPSSTRCSCSAGSW